VHLVYSCKDKFVALLYKSEPSTPTLAKVNQVKDELVIKKETKGKSKHISKKAKVKEEQITP
jgi:hypothetical protein